MSRSLKRCKAISLIELVISIALLALVVTGFYGIEIFSRHHLLSADRRVKLQNECSFLLEHMSKYLLGAMGDFDHPPVTNDTSDGFTLTAYVDSNKDGILDTADPDSRVQYCYENDKCNNQDENHAIFFVSGNGNGELIMRHVTAFNAFLDPATPNLLDITITACWDPQKTCGTADNPAISIQTKIRLPSASIN